MAPSSSETLKIRAGMGSEGGCQVCVWINAKLFIYANNSHFCDRMTKQAYLFIYNFVYTSLSISTFGSECKGGCDGISLHCTMCLYHANNISLIKCYSFCEH